MSADSYVATKAFLIVAIVRNSGVGASGTSVTTGRGLKPTSRSGLTPGPTEKRSQFGGRLFGLVLELVHELGRRSGRQDIDAGDRVLSWDLSRQITTGLARLRTSRSGR